MNRAANWLYKRQWTLVVLIAAAAAALWPAIALAQDAPETDSPPIEFLTNADIWSVLVGLAVPWVAAAINRRAWDSDLKFVVYLGVVVVAAAGTVLLRDDLDAGNYIRTALVVLITASTMYRLWKPAVQEVEIRTG